MGTPMSATPSPGGPRGRGSRATWGLPRVSHDSILSGVGAGARWPVGRDRKAAWGRALRRTLRRGVGRGASLPQAEVGPGVHTRGDSGVGCRLEVQGQRPCGGSEPAGTRQAVRRDRGRRGRSGSWALAARAVKWPEPKRSGRWGPPPEGSVVAEGRGKRRDDVGEGAAAGRPRPLIDTEDGVRLASGVPRPCEG